MKKCLLAFLIALIISNLAFLSASASSDTDDSFKVKIETAASDLHVDDTFSIKVSIYDIVTKNGFGGINLPLTYDASVLSLVYTGSSFTTVHYPASWTGNNDNIEVVRRDKEGKETGELLLMYINDGTLEKPMTAQDDFFVNLEFRCIAVAEDTVISAPEYDLICVDNLTLEEIQGKGFELSVGAISEKNNMPTYIIIAAISAALIAILAVIVFFALKRRKEKQA